MNIQENKKFVENIWDNSIIPALVNYIKIPNKSPLFDPDWQKHGYMDEAADLISTWCLASAIDNMTLEVVRLPKRTPLILLEIPGDSAETVLLYGHFDKQPEMTGWDADLGPWQPVIKNNRLYGRGGADDGYAVFAALAAIKSLHAQQIPHARCVILIEGCEESGSYDLPFYMEALKTRIGKPSLVICLDSGCGNYQQLWITTSLRGMVGGILQIDVLKQGVHSGDAGGIVPSCFMVLRQLLDRLEDKTTGKILLQNLFVSIPQDRLQQANKLAEILGKKLYQNFPFQDHVQPLDTELNELIMNRTWRPALAVIGANGLPPNENAGNVLLPALSVKLSMRLPPTCPAQEALTTIKSTLEKDPPFQAKVQFKAAESATGWNAPPESPWLTQAANDASQHYFGQEAVYMGEGASIPFMGMLGKQFPQAQFMITGVLGPEANAHGPNEFLDIPTAKKLTCCVAEVIAKHFDEQKVVS